MRLKSPEILNESAGIDRTTQLKHLQQIVEINTVLTVSKVVGSIHNSHDAGGVAARQIQRLHPAIARI